MSAVAVKIESRDCKTAGCGGEAAWSRGPFAYLCTSCAAIQRKRLSQVSRDAQARLTPEQRSANSAAGHAAGHAARYSGSAPKVRSVLKDVEQAVVALDKARRDELKAAEAYRAARKAVAAAEQKVNAVRAVLDQAIAGEAPDA